MAENHLQFIREGKSWKDLVDQMTGAGWGFWADSQYTEASPRTITAGQRTQLTIDGLGSRTNLENLNTLPSTVWYNDTFWPVNVGDRYAARLNLVMSRTGNSNWEFAIFEFEVGSFNALTVQQPLYKNIGEPQAVTLSDDLFSLETFVSNGGRIYVTATEQITIWDTTVFFAREYVPKDALE